MNLLNKTKYLFFIILLFLIFSSNSYAQKIDKDCFEIKYLDFFGLDEIDKINWSDSEINELLKTDYSSKFDNTSFLIPILVRYLKDFHPNCNKSIDIERFNKLVALYFKIRLKDVSVIKNKLIEEKLNFIRDDFYNLAQDLKALPKMIYGWNDGPLYGETPKNVPKLSPLEIIATDFGELQIFESNSQIILVATNKENKTIWSRVMNGTNPDRYLKNLKFDKVSIQKTSLATIVNCYSEGERLNLYLKPNGKFMFYFHSW